MRKIGWIEKIPWIVRLGRSWRWQDRKGELGFSQVAGIAIILLTIAFIAFGILPQLSKKGEKVENITVLTTGDMDGDGVPNGLDRCCPKQCAVDKSELSSVAPSDKKYGCAPWQQQVACDDTTTECGTAS